MSKKVFNTPHLFILQGEERDKSFMDFSNVTNRYVLMRDCE